VSVEELIDLLVCPKCHHKLRAAPPSPASASSGLVCQDCKLFYALDDGLPNMLISEARAWPLPAAPASA
jgi:uncharacterized protein YbaR (Trm112 family)